MSRLYYTHRGEPLYRIQDLAQLSGVSPHTIMSWLLAGDLTYFITMYLSKKARIDPETGQVNIKNAAKYYKLGQPCDDDVHIEGTLYYQTDIVSNRPEWDIKRRDQLATPLTPEYIFEPEEDGV